MSYRSLVLACMGASLCVPAAAQHTKLVSVSSTGTQGNAASWDPSISSDGRFIAFFAQASNLVSGDVNGNEWDVFVYDRQLGVTECVSVQPNNNTGNDLSHFHSVSADGRYVAFMSFASDLVTPLADSNGTGDIFVRDRLNGTTTRVSVSSGGVEADDFSSYPAISADGRFVAFESAATNLDGSDTNSSRDVFVHDRQNGTTKRVSVHTSGQEGDSDSFYPSMSADGRFIVFWSFSSNLVVGDGNGVSDAFIHDRQSGTTARVSVTGSGTEGNAASLYPAISADGNYVAFESFATNLLGTGVDTNGFCDIYLWERTTGAFERISVSSTAAQADNESSGPMLSVDGRYIAFESFAANLVGGDTNGFQDIFVRDRQSGTTERVSVRSSGAQASEGSYFAAISADGRYVAFRGHASDLVAGDTNNTLDVFVRDRQAAGAESFCHPGVDGVLPCPCLNPPSGPNRGCDNSSATGGAVLAASGVAYVTEDSLVFTTSGQRPVSTCILVQGSTYAPNGAVFGQGVRCVTGSLKRLYTKAAVGGSITAPSVGDQAISVRSAALGDTIQAGTSRYYFVYYRDPNILGGCVASSSFNTTQTLRVTWSL